MAENQSMWSYGESKIFTSSGSTPTVGGWSYGQNSIYHEYVVSGWLHTWNTIAAINIAKINTIPKANIAKINTI